MLARSAKISAQEVKVLVGLVSVVHSVVLLLANTQVSVTKPV